jgi:ADP-ribose pyrophosphatase YjhB (NUDIX family)
MRERLTARVLLLDPDGRILLMKGRLPSDPHAPGAWFTVGGGVEAGETLGEAALREIREETGFCDAVVGPVLWEGEQIHRDRKGRPLRVLERFMVARCAGGEPGRDGWQALEREFVDDIRWWSQAELAACAESVFPADLAQRLAEVLAAERSAPAHDQFSDGSSAAP